MSKLGRILRRRRSRRERLAMRVDDMLGRASWAVTRWWARGLRSELRRSVTARLRLR